MTPVEAIAWGVIGAIGLCIVCIIVFSTYFWCRQQYINYLLSNYLKKDSNRGKKISNDTWQLEREKGDV